METLAVEWCDQLLTTLWHRIGQAGLDAATLDTVLAAELVRHEAEIRSWLQAQGLAVSRPSIAGYAAVLLTAAQRCGRRIPPAADHDWSNAEWYVVRLLALSAMAPAE